MARRGAAAAPLDANWAAVVRTIAGNDGARSDGPLTAAGFAEPFGIAVAPDGVIYVTDGGSHRVRRITADGRVETLAGGVRGFRDGPATQRSSTHPRRLRSTRLACCTSPTPATTRCGGSRPTASSTTLAGDGTAGDADGRPHDSTGRSVSPSTAAAA